MNFGNVFIRDERNSFEPYPKGDGVMMYNIRYCFGPEKDGGRKMYRRLYSWTLPVSVSYRRGELDMNLHEYYCKKIARLFDYYGYRIKRKIRRGGQRDV